jgi:hypothetical protein
MGAAVRLVCAGVSRGRSLVPWCGYGRLFVMVEVSVGNTRLCMHCALTADAGSQRWAMVVFSWGNDWPAVARREVDLSMIVYCSIRVFCC